VFATFTALAIASGSALSALRPIVALLSRCGAEARFVVPVGQRIACIARVNFAGRAFAIRQFTGRSRGLVLVWIRWRDPDFNLARIVAVATTAPTTAATAASRLAFALGLTRVGTCDGSACRQACLGGAGFGSCFLNRFGTAWVLVAMRAASASARAQLAAAFARCRAFVALRTLLGAAPDQSLWWRVLIRRRALGPIAAATTIGTLAALGALRAIAALGSIFPSLGNGAVALGPVAFGSLASITTLAAFTASTTAPAASAARTSVAAVATRFTSRSGRQRRRCDGTLGCHSHVG